MATIQELKDAADAIDKIVGEKIISDNPNIVAIKDGILDFEKYFHAKYKILWILKEPYDDFDEDGKPFGGGWHYRDFINPKQFIKDFTSGRETIEPMIYTTWGILNDFCLWSDMEDADKDATILNALKSAAIINVKKLPGQKTSPWNIIEKAYQRYKEILLKQIKCYNPDIIIFGLTLSHFFTDLGLKREEMKVNGSVNYIINDNKIFIEAYHPSQPANKTKVSQEQYCNDIINAVKISVKCS
jgi:hypothetical protein